MKWWLSPALLGTIFIASCIDSSTSRYLQPLDGAPLRDLKPADVADAVPRPDPLLPQGNKSPYKVNGKRYHVLGKVGDYRARGRASWYGTKFHGHQTSNGELFDLYKATAAHKTLPIPSYARVTNIGNGRSVVVRVNDRGPFHSERIIDLSYAAAVKLGFVQRGTAEVEVVAIVPAGVDDRRASGGAYRYLQLGAFSSEDSARRLQQAVGSRVDATVFVSAVESAGNLLYRVRLGPVSSARELLGIQQKLQDSGFDGGQPLP